MLSALVIGATGLVGTELIRRLGENHAFERVVALVRRPMEAPPKVEVVQVDFDHLDAVPHVFHVSHVFCALGTTLKQAGSRERFTQVDYGIPLRVARLARAAGARHFLLVSSLGANPRSRVFYGRVKGALEQSLAPLGYASLTIIRPSLLLGDRPEFRLGERIATLLAWTFPARYRAVEARDVAAALVEAAVEDKPGLKVIANREIGRR
jgi:uncharacterized protein YbjT (DUF2867 family)